MLYRTTLWFEHYSLGGECKCCATTKEKERITAVRGENHCFFNLFMVCACLVIDYFSPGGLTIYERDKDKGGILTSERHLEFI